MVQAQVVTRAQEAVACPRLVAPEHRPATAPCVDPVRDPLIEHLRRCTLHQRTV